MHRARPCTKGHAGSVRRYRLTRTLLRQIVVAGASTARPCPECPHRLRCPETAFCSRIARAPQSSAQRPSDGHSFGCRLRRLWRAPPSQHADYPGEARTLCAPAPRTGSYRMAVCDRRFRAASRGAATVRLAASASDYVRSTTPTGRFRRSPELSRPVRHIRGTRN